MNFKTEHINKVSNFCQLAVKMEKQKNSISMIDENSNKMIMEKVVKGFTVEFNLILNNRLWWEGIEINESTKALYQSLVKTFHEREDDITLDLRFACSDLWKKL